jgi:hypothetical protein
MELPDIAKVYFHSVRLADFEAAAQCFSPDVFYSHEAFDPGSAGPTGTRLEARSREDLVRLFRMRGDRNWKHHIQVDAVGNKFFIQGVVTDEEENEVLSFVSIGTLADDGLIKSYIEYDARPAVGHWPAPHA